MSTFAPASKKVTSALPTAPLSEVPNQPLKFPLENREAYSGRMRFEVYNTTFLSLETQKPLLSSLFDNLLKQPSYLVDASELPGFNREQDPDPINDSELEEAQKAFFSGFSYDRSEERGPIDMYFPIAPIFNDAITYDDANLNFLGSRAFGLAKEAGSIGNITSEVLLDGLKNLFSYIGSGQVDDATTLGVQRLSQFAGTGLGNAATAALGVTVNPNTRSLFKGVGIRQFAFTFKLIPTSAEESREIENIIRVFREEAYPDTFGPEDFPIGYRFPNVFKITFKHRNQTAKLPKLEFCYLRGVQHVYNATGNTFHADGQPNSVDLTLQFAEIRALNKRDIQRGA